MDEEQGSNRSGSVRELPQVVGTKDVEKASGSEGTATTSSEAEKQKPPAAAVAESFVPNPVKATNAKVIVHFRDAELSKDLQGSVHAEAGTPEAAHARLLNGFFSVLALCHTVLTSVDPTTKSIEYKAQSPDEAALVQAAADMGFVFRGRDREVLLLQTPFSSSSASSTPSGLDRSTGVESQEGSGEALERYELLNILEFTSARKRMSVVVRKLDGDDQRLFLMTKGADNVIFERLKKGSGEELKRQTEKALDEFASEGLRTLTLAYKVISGKNILIYLPVYRQLADTSVCRGILSGLGRTVS